MKAYSEEKPKRRILYAAVELLFRGEELTIRKIADQADVGTGLINYHFGNRETLINEAVRTFLREEVVPSGFETLGAVEMAPSDLLKTACRGGFGYFAHNREISRTALLYDLKDPREGDTISKGMELFLPLVRAAAGPDTAESHVRKAVWLLIGFIQLVFLRAEQFKTDTEIDYFSDEERNSLIDETVDMMIQIIRVKEEHEQ